MDTAQLSGAAETDPETLLSNAADAFKAFDNPVANRKRDEAGKFAAEQEPEEIEGELEAHVADDEPDDDGDEQEAAEQAQPMPPSWGADDAELWESLPPETQAKIAAREGERDRGLNLKLQEAANARKAVEARVGELSTKLESLDRVIGTVEAIYKTPEPDARAFGYGTQQFNEPAFVAAHQQWQQSEQLLAQLTEQREAALKEKTTAEQDAFAEWKQQHEQTFAPKLLADVPELKDPAKGEPALRAMLDYAVEQGIPAENFAEDAIGDITSAQLHILWKAQQLDKLRASNSAPKPKPVGPAVKPGVSSPRSAQRTARRQRDFDRLDREGSIEAGAAVFKHFL